MVAKKLPEAICLFMRESHSHWKAGVVLAQQVIGVISKAKAAALDWVGLQMLQMGSQEFSRSSDFDLISNAFFFFCLFRTCSSKSS